MISRSVVACFLVLSSSAVVFAAENEVRQRTVSVAGTAVTQVVPDIIVWHISTSDFDKNLQVAKNASDEKLKSILKLREELGVKPEDVQTGYLSIEKEYERDQHGNRGAFKHFVVRRSVTLKQRDLKRFDEFLSKLVGSAEIEASFGFESSRQYEARAETRLKALRLAREKAEAMTRELGAKLGKVLTIDEYKPQQQTGMWAAQSNGGFFDTSRPVDDLISGTFAPGSIEVRVTVEAVFEIE
jgi:uncharacterized protein YggE